MTELCAPCLIAMPSPSQATSQPNYPRAVTTLAGTSMCLNCARRHGPSHGFRLYQEPPKFCSEPNCTICTTHEHLTPNLAVGKNP